MVRTIAVMGVVACGAPGEPGMLDVDEVWADGTYGLSLRIHDQSEPTKGKLCTLDGDCTKSDREGRVWVEGLEPGPTLLEVIHADAIRTLVAVDVRQDAWSSPSTHAYDADFVPRFLPTPDTWDDAATGMVDLWVVDKSTDLFTPLAGATVESEGDVLVSDGGAVVPGDETLGGPTWIANLPPGEHGIRVSVPSGQCHQGFMGWPAAAGDTISVPVEAGTITSVWVGCVPR